MEEEFVSTTGKYVQYCLATQGSWKFKRIDKVARYHQIFEALSASTRVKKMLLFCNLSDEDLYLLANAIESNKTLEELSLTGLWFDTPLGFAAVLQALENHQPKITKFACHDRHEIMEIEWTAFKEFLRSSPSLQDLSLAESVLNEEQVIELMEVLKAYNTELVSLHLGNHNNSIPSMTAIAQYVASNTKLTHLEIDEAEYSEEIAAQIHDMMQNNTSLTSIYYRGFIDLSDMTERNKKANVKPPQQFNSPSVRKPSQPVLLPDTTHEPVIKQLSPDILRLILWQLSVKPLCAFRATDKQFYKFTKGNAFWRGYYSKYFSCIPNDVLLLTNLSYGLKLANARTVNEAFATPLWEEIVINSFRARHIKGEQYPANHPVPFMEPVYRRYPQLIGTKESEAAYTEIVPDNDLLKGKGVPYSYTWFLIYANHSVLYHLGFEKLKDGQYNGILFKTADFPCAYDARFNCIEEIFGWFAAKNEVEFAEKCKTLCEVFLSTRENSRNQGFVHAPFYDNVVTRVLQPAFDARDRLADSLTETIESAATKYCTTHDPDASFGLVQELLKKFKEASNIPNLDIEQVRQSIPKRSDLKAKYLRGKDSDYYYQFDYHYFDMPTDKKLIYEAPKHRKEHKDIPQVAIRKLYRVALNFILMPVLKTFWLDDMKDSDFETYPFLKWRKEALNFKNVITSDPYVPFSHVSISSAHPSSWPLIALALADHLLPYIIDALNGLLEETGCSSNGLEKLISVLDQASLLIPQGVKLFMQNLATLIPQINLI